MSWREQITFDELIIISALCYTNTLSWIFVLSHWNNSPREDMVFHSESRTPYAESEITSLCSIYLFLGEATNTNFVVFGLTRPGLEPTIYRTQHEHSNHYT
jgi:hypothetical protein